MGKKTDPGHFPGRIRALPTFDGPFDAYRLAADGWTLVTVNKSNYWVFKK